MYAYDFEYDGKLLSDFGFIVCDFNGSKGADTADMGSEIVFQTTPIHNGKRFLVTGTTYDTCLSTKFHICKDPDLYENEEMEISNEDFRILSRWLNRKEFLWFHSFDWYEPDKEEPWFRASFTLSKINIGEKLYGIELSMSTDSPFGYGREEIESFSFTSGNLSKILIDKNDEIGKTYPALTITCNQGGNLILTDNITDCSCRINNCSNNEVISFSGESMIISTSLSAHEATLHDDFNFDYFCFENTYINKTNIITASIPCTVEIRYRPIIKDTL